MTVYVVETEYRTGSYAEVPGSWVECVVSTKEKAREKILNLAKEAIEEGDSFDAGYPKIIKDEETCVTVARNHYKDQDISEYHYTEYEVE